MSKTVAAGRSMRVLVAMVLMADGAFGLAAPAALRAELTASGFPLWTGAVIGASALTSGIAYAVPRTAVLGAILATAFLGGAICAHLRLGEIGSPPQLMSILIGTGSAAADSESG